MSYKTEFLTFTIKQGMEAEADAWMRILVERQAECVQTLDRERMHYECVVDIGADQVGVGAQRRDAHFVCGISIPGE